MQKHIHKLTKIHQKNDKIWQKMQKKQKQNKNKIKIENMKKTWQKRKTEINWDNLSWKIFLNTNLVRTTIDKLRTKMKKKEKSR